ncbi:MAG: isoprenylcysteine carboxylmethyltransferase family protein [Deltaproteobacteria bacterium]|nr:isoprenylcysteine carboxylmethyltransferase family protein [Deltaproteobacteria bacterium]
MASVTIFQIVAFILASIVIAALSWRSLGNPKCHGFYRFFAFEAILVILVLNVPFWIKEAFSPAQIVSWFLLIFSIVFVVQGVYWLRKIGGAAQRTDSPEAFAFENTANLVSEGIYKYIRHPLYSSLLLLTCGAFLKHITIAGGVAAIVATAALIVTAKMDERECLDIFGSAYAAYMKESKMFIPYLF